MYRVPYAAKLAYLISNYRISNHEREQLQVGLLPTVAYFDELVKQLPI